MTKFYDLKKQNLLIENYAETTHILRRLHQKIEKSMGLILINSKCLI